MATSTLKASQPITEGINFQKFMVRGTIYGLLVLVGLVFLLPIYMTTVTALKPRAETTLNTAWDLPDGLYLENFERAYDQLKNNLGNSVVEVIMATTISAVMGSINGYVLSKWHVPGERFLFPLMLFGMFLPYQAILIPLFEFMSSINIFGYRLYGGIPGLVLIHVVYGLPITTLIFRNFYIEIPDEMLEAAAIDGAGFWSLYTEVVFPLSLPGFVVVIIWQFTQIWNDFLFAIFMTTEANNPITVPLAELSGGEAVDYNLTMAGAILAALPPLFVYIVAGRYFIRGLLAGSIKG
ncbi:MAG: carbohydrate ABC transporter permease [Aggregatilineales bacterium]